MTTVGSLLDFHEPDIRLGEIMSDLGHRSMKESRFYSSCAKRINH